MSNAGYATLTILPSAKGFKSALTKEVGGDMESVGRSGGATAGKGFGGGFLPAVKGFMGPALGIAAGLGIGQGIKTGLATASFMEQAKISFETLLGSGGEAEKMLTNISKFAAATPFELPGLTDNARSLLGVGIAADQVIPTMTALGDAAGALGLSQEGLNSVVRAYSQIQSKGKVSAEEMLQISEAGIPIWSVLSRAMGKPVAELQKMGEKGELLAKDVLPLLNQQMEKDYGGSMAKQAQTLAGVWSTVQDTINMATAKALQPLVPLLTTILPPAANMLATAIGWTSDSIVGLAQKAAPGFGRIKDAATGLFDLFAKGDFTAKLGNALNVSEDAPIVSFLFSLRDAAISIGGTLGQVFEPVLAVLPRLLTSFSPLGLLFKALEPVLPALATAFGQLGATIGSVLGVAVVNVQPVIASLVSAFSGVFLAIMPSVVQIVGTLGNAFATLAPMIFGVLNAVGPLVATLIGQLAPIVGQVAFAFASLVQMVLPFAIQMVGMLASTFTTLAPVIFGVIGSITPLISTLIGQLVPVIMNLVAAVMPQIVSSFGMVISAVGPLISIIAGLLVPVIQALMPVVVTVFGVVSSVIQSAMQIVQGVIQVVTGIISGNWSQVWSGIQNVFSGIWNTIGAVVRGAINLVVSAIGAGLNIASSVVGGALNAIGGFFSAVWNGITGSVRNAWNGILGAVTGGIGSVLGALGGLPGQALAAVSGMVGSFTSIGGQMIAGLAAGISNAAGMIRDAVANAIGNVVDFAKSLLGIHSPSRVFMAIGDFTAKGMAIGLTKGAKYVLKASDALIPKTPSYTAPTVTPGGLQGALAGAAGTTQPTIVQENHFNTPMDEETVAELSARKLLRAGVGR